MISCFCLESKYEFEFLTMLLFFYILGDNFEDDFDSFDFSRCYVLTIFLILLLYIELIGHDYLILLLLLRPIVLLESEKINVLARLGVQ
jgi:hypothetical protein